MFGPSRASLRQAAVCLAAVIHVLPATASSETITVKLDGEASKSILEIGVTFTQNTLRSCGDSAAIGSAKQILHRVAPFENVPIMGWGSPNPEPSPGHFDWSGLDTRMALVRETGGVPVITLCCAPDWLKGGASAQTDWSHLTVAPSASRFHDFAELARQIALRYPDVKYYQVWNELKGFWDNKDNRWNYEAYTSFYNDVFDALKSVSPSLQVGGPYTPMSHALSSPASQRSSVSGAYGIVDRRVMDAFEYWLANKHGADFVTIDGSTLPIEGRAADPFENLSFYSDTNTWIRSQTQLPIWWAEWYSVPDDLDRLPEPLEHARQNALMSTTLVEMSRSVSVALRWGPESGQPPFELEGGQEGVWTSTTRKDGGKELPFAKSMEAFEACFPRGQKVIGPKTPDRRVSVLSSERCLLAINRTADDLEVDVEAEKVHLSPFAVLYIQHH